MRYVFRADASPSVGAGHVMRSSAIAEEMILQGEEAIFIGLIVELDWVANRIKNLGFSKVYSYADEFSPNKDTDVLILDSYSIEIDDPTINVIKWHSVVAIVDTVTPNYICNLRIHPGFDSLTLEGDDTRLLSGAKYIPFRKAIKTRVGKSVNHSGSLKIIVNSGGTDSFGLVSLLAKELQKMSYEFQAYLFTNSNLPKGFDHRFKVMPIGPEIDFTAEVADLVFTTASTSSLEFIARGLPVAILCVADNQESYYNRLHELGVAIQVGKRNSDQSWELNLNKIQMLVSSREFRLNLSRRAENFIDLAGAARIVDAIKSL